MSDKSEKTQITTTTLNPFGDKNATIPGLDLLDRPPRSSDSPPSPNPDEEKSEHSRNGLRKTDNKRTEKPQQPPLPNSHSSSKSKQPSGRTHGDTAVAGVNNVVERFLKNAQMKQAPPPAASRKGPRTPPDPEEEEYDPGRPIDDSEEYDPAIPITDSEDYDPSVPTTDPEQDSLGKRLAGLTGIAGMMDEEEEEEEDEGTTSYEEAPREDLMDRIAKMRGMFGQSSDEGKHHRHRFVAIFVDHMKNFSGIWATFLSKMFFVLHIFRKISLQKQNFPGIRFPNCTSFPCMVDHKYYHIRNSLSQLVDFKCVFEK